MSEVRQWCEIADDFRDTLVLGNGASVAVHSEFWYGSLKEEAKVRGFLNSDGNLESEGVDIFDVEDVFQLLGTEDFELVLNLLWHARHVNEAFSIEDAKTGPAYDLVKDALIKTVREVHCSRIAIQEHLRNIYGFMGRFETVLSLNYDLIAYWGLLAGNDEIRRDRFKDCFTWERTFDPDWAEQRTAKAGDEPTTTLVFYPHGNLVLKKRPSGGERKVVAGPNFLLDRILETWDDEWTPLFVSEGLSKQKKDRIDDSTYLTTVYGEVMRDVGDTLAVYGWDLKDNDQHLIDRLFGKAMTKVAISVYLPIVKDDLEGHCHRVEKAISDASPGLRKPEVIFFDAESPGCWIHS